jgi:hypothetical protein
LEKAVVNSKKEKSVDVAAVVDEDERVKFMGIFLL